MAVMEKFQVDDGGCNKEETPTYYGEPNFENPGISQNGGITQWITNSNIPIKGHRKENRGLHEGKTMDKIGLGNAGIQADFSNEPPQDPQHCVECGQPHAQVSEGQHGQEVEHGLVQAGLCPDHMQHHAVSQKNQGIDGGEGNGKPGIVLVQAREPCENEY